MSRTTRVFNDTGEFVASRAAEDWCAARGLSVGVMQRGAPRGIVRGDADVMKWRNLSKWDKLALVGRMEGDMRNGPVTVALDIDEPEVAALARAGA